MLKNNSSKEIFIALDANAIVHRAFHAFPPNLITSSGLQVNAAYGFTSMFLKILEMYDPKYLVCAFDTGKPTFRHAKYSDYKGTRKPTDQSLIDQFPVVESIVSAFNVPIVKKDGYEADDVLGTFAKWVTDGKWSDRNIHLYIVSGDRDLFQLVNENISEILPEGSFKNLKVFDDNGVHEKLRIFPGQVVDYKA
jgi:DNA polymerase-1